MKFYTILLSVFALAFFTSCGPTIYQAPKFEKTKSKHKLLAILPFSVQIDSKKLPKNVSSEMIRDEEKNTGYSIQNHSYTYFLKEKSKKKYSVDFQDIDKTNALLSKSGISYEQLKDYSKEELCRLLDVDAVISAKVKLEKPMSELGALAVGILFDVWTSTNKVHVSMTIHDKLNSDLLWKYDWEAEGSVGSSSEKLTKSLMKNVSKKFPYQKE
jgi:hypothetical protein